jgi:hypothetical protein
MQDEDNTPLGGSFDLAEAESEMIKEDKLTPSTGKVVTTRIQEGTPIVSKHTTQYSGNIREHYFVTMQLIFTSNKVCTVIGSYHSSQN